MTWEELCEWCKKRDAKIRKPWFGLGMQRIEFPISDFGVGIGSAISHTDKGIIIGVMNIIGNATILIVKVLILMVLTSRPLTGNGKIH